MFFTLYDKLCLYVGRLPICDLKAPACGTLVVAIAVGGIPEQVKSLEQTQYKVSNIRRWEGATGILVLLGNAEAMAKAIVTLLTDKTLYQHLSKNVAQEVQCLSQQRSRDYEIFKKRTGKTDGKAT